MKERILEFLKKENKSSAQLAEEIGVQPSGISHIISGRNNPSLDFVIRMLEKYPFLSNEWLLFGKGEMYKKRAVPSLFDENQDIEIDKTTDSIKRTDDKTHSDLKALMEDDEQRKSFPIKTLKTSGVKKIVWFYDNNSFEEYYPQSD